MSSKKRYTNTTALFIVKDNSNLQQLIQNYNCTMIEYSREKDDEELKLIEDDTPLIVAIARKAFQGIDVQPLHFEFAGHPRVHKHFYDKTDFIITTGEPKSLFIGGHKRRKILLQYIAELKDYFTTREVLPKSFRYREDTLRLYQQLDNRFDPSIMQEFTDSDRSLPINLMDMADRIRKVSTAGYAEDIRHYVPRTFVMPILDLLAFHSRFTFLGNDISPIVGINNWTIGHTL